MRLNKKYILKLILCLVGFVNYAQSDTITIQFTSSDADVTSVHKNIIDSAFGSLLDTSNYDVRILGWTDSKGTVKMNKLLSERRAFNVYSYITETFGEDKWHSIVYNGNGEMQQIGTAEEKRQVMIILSKRFDSLDEENSILTNIAIGESVVLENFIFEPGQHYLKKESIPYLFELLEILSNNKSIKIQIEGHVWAFYVGDTVEERENAQLLSERRAKNIHDFLLLQGASINCFLS